MTPSVKVAKKLVDAFKVTMDYLVDDSGNITEIKDKSMLERLQAIENLESKYKNTIVHVIDILLRDAKARKTYAVQ